MKPTTFIMIIWGILMALRISGFFPVPTWILVIVFIFWFLILYNRVHNENKRVNTPSPVYLTSPEG